MFGRGKDSVVVVNGLSLTLYEGQITVLLGPNGAGKTRLVEMLVGMCHEGPGKAPQASSHGFMSGMRHTTIHNKYMRKSNIK